MDCFASLAMTTKHTFAFSPHAVARGLPDSCRLALIKGAGNAGRPMRPTVSCAGWSRRRTRAYRSHRLHPAFPTQWFTAYFVLSPANRAFLPPSPAEMTSANLTPASGCQDHTTSPSASAPFVKGASTSTASRPASVTIAKRPFGGAGRGAYRPDLGRGASTIFEIRKIFFEIRHRPVMAGLVPAIHVFGRNEKSKTWMPGTRPGMTAAAVAGARASPSPPSPEPNTHFCVVTCRDL
jgi:hypothetical protein